MELKFIKPKEIRGRAKITVHKTGKFGFSKDASNLLDLENNMFCKFGHDEDKNFYIVMCTSSDEETFKVSKAGDYYYAIVKSLLNDLNIDYKSKNTHIFDIERTQKDNVFKLNKRIIMKE